MNSNKNQPKKKTLLDDFNELEEYSKKQNYEANIESELSESNTINADTESISKMNTSRQPDHDFCDDLSSANQYKSNQAKKFSTMSKAQASSTAGSQIIGGRNHAPQVIDEDTEHFKVKIEHLLNVFKTDAISEFMGMKRSMLEDQRISVKNQTERYLQMYEDKHKEQTETKEKLEEQIRINGILKERLEKMSAITQKAKARFHTQKSLQFFFAAIKSYKKYKIEQKKKNKLAQLVAEKNLKQRVFSSFYKVCKEGKHQSDLEKKEKQHLIEIDEITNRFNKEMALLKEQLQETQLQLNSIQYTKEQMSENLKKAFMRGVCALNFEAMNVIQGSQVGFNPDVFLSQLDNPQQTQVNNNSQLKNISQATSAISQSYVVQNSAQQQQIMQMQQQQLQAQQAQNEVALMQSIVQKNPQQYSSMIINHADNNTNYQTLSNQAQQIQQINSIQNNLSSNLQTNMSSSSSNNNNNIDSLEFERINQIEFLKKELEQIQKIAGVQLQNQYASKQQTEPDQNQYEQNLKFANNDEDFQQKKIVIFQEPKVESKDHRWKNAPVVGLPNKTQNLSNKENQQDFMQNQSILPNFVDQQSNFNQEDDCKVIRVNAQSQEFQNTQKFDKTIKPNAKPPVKEPMPQKYVPSTVSSASNNKSSHSLSTSQSGKSISNSATQKSNLGTPSKAITKTTTTKK
ncbi:hypothetical protein TTHERM_00079160 (macronuclear) [Tetrahymena thermophila SB210]|uniref:Centrosomal protein POC5 n=1 Tax=Tetrahymena thermophila (strain SB210) TaxID=312017 RepID=Q23FU8_TETTS|nr:hypothetical protein TTHERM_00079160 [Tetrahymena thermophila SB210]EAR95512.2 hypothetical protein TTHERM_00079160 [Tetrahymena thermophila SB210]|eukprot:XP_001015757.2 hypothetical protein TTHERM_00079160 [Tetrahymena thermophila SB210]